jgi:hypothetical protein
MSSVELNKHTYRKEKRNITVVAGAVVSMEVNSEKTKFVFMSCEQNGGQQHNIHIGTFEISNIWEQLSFMYVCMYVFIYLFTDSFCSLYYGRYIACNCNESKLIS